MSDLVDIRASLINMLTEVEQTGSLTDEDITAINQYLGDLEAMSENHPAVVELTTQIRQRAESMVEANSALIFGNAALGSIATNALEQAEGERAARVDLEGAIEDGDESHPKLRDFADMIRQDARDDYEGWMEDEGWPEAMAEAFEEIRCEMIERIQRLTGCGSQAASKFLSVMLGRRAQFNEYQGEMFTAFIDSFEEVEALNGRH